MKMFIFQILNEKKVNMQVAQSCPTLCDPMDYTVHGILQARILEWVAYPFSKGSSQPRDRTQVSHTAVWIFNLSHQGSPRTQEWVAYSFSSRSSWPRNWTRVFCIAGGFFTNWAMKRRWDREKSRHPDHHQQRPKMDKVRYSASI